MDNPQPKQRFTGYWIPAELSKLGLSKIEQFLLAMIDSLEQDAPEYCFASNKYLAEQMELSESRVSFYITKFKRMGLLEEVGFDGRRRRLRTLKQNWYKASEEFSKKELCVKPISPTTRKHEVRVRENANHIKNIDIEEDIIADPPPIAPSSAKAKPAGGNNNNFYKCLDNCEDLSPRQKGQFSKYPEEVVQKAVKYCYHPNTKLQGPNAKIKQLHAFCKEPEAYEDALKELDNPDKGKSPKEKILSRFKRGNLYNGFEFNFSDTGPYFLHPNGVHTYGLDWKQTKFEEKWKELLIKLKIE